MKNVFRIAMVGFLLTACASADDNTVVPTPLRYVAVGDSLTIGTSVELQQAWPSLLIEHLKRDGLIVESYTNLGRAGWTSADVLRDQLDEFQQENPNFGTLLVGANDLFQNISPAEFDTNFTALVEGMLISLPDPSRLVVLTIPDYTRTPLGMIYGQRGGFEYDIEEYNAVIRREAKARGLTLVDMYEESQWIMFDVGLLSDDGLHPSVRGHEKWEEAVYTVVSKLLR